MASEDALTLYRRSQLQAIDEGCLYRYNEIWNKGVDDTSDIALVGIGLHKVKYRYVMKLMQYEVESDSILAQEAFTEGIGAAQTPNRLIPEMREIWDFHSERFEAPLQTFVTAEERQVVGSRMFTPDVVTAETRLNQLTVHDDKWGWQPPMTTEELKVLFQARAYILFAQERWPGFANYRFVLHAVRFNRSVEVVFTDTELDEIRRDVIAHIETIKHAQEANSWPAVAGPSCRFCELACPLVDNPVVIPKRFVSEAQAVKMGGWIMAADKLVKGAKKALKGYVAVHGPVNVNGVVWDNRVSLERRYPIDVVLDVLKMRNLLGAFEDPKQQGMTISHSALVKLFKAHPEIEKDLENFRQSKEKYKFSAKQFKDEEDDTDE